MAFGFFNKDKTDSPKDEKNLGAIFKKISLNPKAAPNKSLMHDIEDDKMFGQISGNAPGYNGYPQDQSAFSENNVSNDGQRVVAESSAFFASESTSNQPKLQNQFSNQYPSDQGVQPQASEETKQDDGPVYKVGNGNKYYTYKSDDAYLDEAGRDSNHLYIGPGEPLTKKKREPQKPLTPEEAQTEFFEKARAQENKNMTTPPSFASSLTMGKTVSLNNFDHSADSQASQTQSELRAHYAGANNVNRNVNAQSNIQNQQSSDSVPPYQGSQSQTISFDKTNLFQNVRNSAQAHQQQRSDVPHENKVNFGFKLALCVRQLFASFFNYTTLGVIFSRTSLRMGPSAPCLMPIPYFAIGFLGALIVMFLQTYAKSSICAEIAVFFFLSTFGVRGFTGIGNFFTNFCHRKIDTYSKCILTIMIVLIFSSSFEYYIEELKPDFNFSLGFGVIVMLSALTAATLNFGGNDDPENSFGTMSATQLIISLVVYIGLTFTVLDYEIVISLLGISIFSRVVLGQYMYVKGIVASRENVLAVQLITLILLMLDLLFSTGTFNFIGPLLITQ